MNFFEQVFSQYQKQVEAGAKKFLVDEADRAIAITKKLTPVDTGTLRNNFFRTKVKVDKNVYSIEIINNIHYAVPVEYGHNTRRSRTKKSNVRWVQGFFMLKQGIDKVVQGFTGRLEKYIPELGAR